MTSDNASHPETTMTRKTRSTLGTLIALGLAAGCQSSPAGTPTVEDEEEVFTRSQALSDCAREAIDRYADTPHVLLHLWRTADGTDYRVSSHPQWHGCEGDTRVGDRRDGVYQFVRVLGLVYRPEAPQPAETVAVDTYFSQGRHTVEQDTPFARKPGEHVRMEGYMHSLLWRPPAGSVPGVYQPVYLAGPADGLYLDTVAPTGGQVAGYTLQPDSVSAARGQACTQDSDCPQSRLCYVTKANIALSDGTTGTCMERCQTNGDCTEEVAPRCDIRQQHCVAPIVRYDGDQATFSRASRGSYHFRHDALSWAGRDELRWDDRGDGHGPQPLLEGASTNLVAGHADLTEAAPYNLATLTRTTEGPGPDRAFSLTARSNGLQGFYLRDPVALDDDQLVMSIWSRTGVRSGDLRRHRLESRGLGLSVLVSEEWQRANVATSADRTGRWQVYSGWSGGAPVAAGDSDQFAYLQVEPGRFPTSVIPLAEGGGDIASRAADELTVRTSDERLGGAWRVYVWPDFDSTSDSPDDASYTIASFEGGVGERVTLSIENRNRIVLKNATATLASLATFWRPGQMLVIDVSLAEGWMDAHTPYTNRVTFLPRPITPPIRMDVGRNADGTSPFFGRVSEPLPLAEQTDSRAPSVSLFELTNGMTGAADLQFRGSASAGRMFVIAEVEELTRTANAYGRDTPFTYRVTRVLRPGIINRVTLGADHAGAIGLSSPREVLAAGDPVPDRPGTWAHYRATHSVGGEQLLLDLSGNGNDAWSGSAPGEGVDLARRDRMTFDNQDDSWDLPGPFTASDGSFVTVIERRPNDAREILWQARSPGTEVAVTPNGALDVVLGGVSTTVPVDLAPQELHLIQVHWNGGDLEAFVVVDGVVHEVAMGTMPIELGGKIGIGSFGEDPYGGHMYEAILGYDFDEGLPDAERDLAYLQRRYRVDTLLENGSFRSQSSHELSWRWDVDAPAPAVASTLRGSDRTEPTSVFGFYSQRVEASYVPPGGHVSLYQQVLAEGEAAPFTGNVPMAGSVWLKSRRGGATATFFVGPTSDPADAIATKSVTVGRNWALSELPTFDLPAAGPLVFGVAIHEPELIWVDDAYLGRAVNLSE